MVVRHPNYSLIMKSIFSNIDPSRTIETEGVTSESACKPGQAERVHIQVFHSCCDRNNQVKKVLQS
jgi:hypothetical protein